MGEFFRDGGWGMYPTTVFGFVLLTAAVLALLRPGRGLAAVAALGAATVGSGILGTSMGLINTFKWVRGAPEIERFPGLMTGAAESLNNLVLAMVIVVPALLIAAAASLRAPARVPTSSPFPE